MTNPWLFGSSREFAKCFTWSYFLPCVKKHCVWYKPPVCSVVHPLDWLTRELSSYIKPHTFISCGQFIEVFFLLMTCFMRCCRPLRTPTSCVHAMNLMTLSWYCLVLCSGPRVDCCMWPWFKKEGDYFILRLTLVKIKPKLLLFSVLIFLKLCYSYNFIYLFKMQNSSTI